MLNLLKLSLLLFIDDIDSGNSNISEKELEEIIELILKINYKELTKIEAANYIGVSRATFDNYIAKGLIPKGHKRLGLTTLGWNKVDLDKFNQTKKKKK